VKDPYDRTVHAARADGTAIVRYERAGKWYAEKPDGTRRAITLKDAVVEAMAGDAEPGGYVNRGRAGGLSFNSALRKAEAAAAIEARKATR
jgi:hypothetical protein